MAARAEQYEHAEDQDSTSSEAAENGGDDEEGWEDQEDDNITESFISLFDDRVFDDVKVMLEHCKAHYSFDIWHLQQQNDLDEYGLIKLVNYVRKQVLKGVRSPDVSCKTAFDRDEYLRPVLENDAVLYSLGDILVEARPSATNEIEQLRDELAAIKASYAAYREDIRNQSDLVLETTNHHSTRSTGPATTLAEAIRKPDTAEDVDYFHSYSFNSIHETMLKDKIRTNAYLDFIYHNKDVFEGKIVLDVGCGTGILSMFCAKAGAKEVIAVDNSGIIDTARQIIADNGLGSQIRCLKGKIEEVQLPYEKVDIIVSEWMGYCLLYESMLDSVIFARDKYLAADGLMVPSHATIKVTSLIDSELKVSHIDFWKDVYGFDMQAMLGRAHEEAVVKVVDPDELGGDGVTLALLDLHKTTVENLDVEAKFELPPSKREGLLEGFVLWFDIFFTRSRFVDMDVHKLNATAFTMNGTTVLTTSPHIDPTHWQQSTCLIQDPQDRIDPTSCVSGAVSFSKRKKRTRALNIDMKWQVGSYPARTQAWFVD